MAYIRQPFCAGYQLDWRLVLFFVLINGLVLVNAYQHPPAIGYDAREHLLYIRALSHARMVDRTDTSQFFSPPLSYTIPAIFRLFAGETSRSASKFAQYLNVALSLGLTYFLLKTCLMINPNPAFRLGALFFLGILPVYYKTFALVRGEPYLAFFSVIVLYIMTKILLNRDWRRSIMLWLGTALGLSILSRQWGFLLFPPVCILAAIEWIHLPTLRRVITGGLAICLVMAAAIGGWFYVSLYVRFGSLTAFNRNLNPQFSFTNQPLEFYMGLGRKYIFTTPVRPYFGNKFWPIFYSETWGDYSMVFLIYGRDVQNNSYLHGTALTNRARQGPQPDRLDTNYFEFHTYLGRVNLVSLYPSLLGAGALIFALIRLFFNKLDDPVYRIRKTITLFMLLVIAFTLLGYAWFLIMVPNPGNGDTVKPTYVLQVFPFIAILVGSALMQLQQKSRRLYSLALIGLALVCIHNLPAMITHYPSLP